MDIFDELEEATNYQLAYGDLPVWLAEAVLEVARNRDKYRDKEYLIELLLMQVREYDTYAEAGCCKWAFDWEDIKRSLKKLLEE
jgi:hypothetical protein